MNITVQRFFHSLKWGVAESTFYQIFFVVHHAILFSVCPASTYGVAGILFSALFTAMGLCNLGLDLLFAPYITSWSQSKKDFYFFLSYHVPFTLVAIATVIIAAGFWLAGSYILLWATISIILLIESARKTLKTILRLVSYNREVALIEIGTFIFYMMMVWGWYQITMHISLMNIFLPLVISGSCSMLVLLIYTMHWYATLPQTSSIDTQIPPIATRMPLVTHQITGALLSPNILVLLCSLRLEITQIASVKLLSTFIQSITLILNKVFATSTAILYSLPHTKEAPNKLPSAHLLSRMLNTGLNILTVMTIAALSICAVLAIPISTLTLLAILLSIVTCYLATYEQLFISHTKVNYLLIANVITLTMLIGISQLIHSVSTSFIMGLFLLLRVITAIILSRVAFNYWQVTLNTIHKATLIFGLLTTTFLLIRVFA